MIMKEDYVSRVLGMSDITPIEGVLRRQVMRLSYHSLDDC